MLRKVTETEAWCAPCGQMHPREAFGRRRDSATGLAFACKAAVSRRNKTAHEKNGARRAARHRELREDRRTGPDRMRWWAKKMLSDAQRRATAKGLPFDIHLSDLGALPYRCPILGLELVYQARGRRQDGSASLDRIDSQRGYVRGNVWVISWRANQIKNDGTAAELRAVADALDARVGKANDPGTLDGVTHHARPQL